MKRKLKSCISLLLAVLMLTAAFTAMPLTAGAAENDEKSVGTISDGQAVNCSWTFNESTGVLTISGSGEMDCPAYFINNETGIKEIVINSGITSISDYAFYGARGLTKITLPNTLRTIGDYAFEFCRRLTDVVLPSNLIYIGYGAFYECNSLETINFGSKLETVRPFAFVNTAIKTFVIPESVTSLGDKCIGYNYESTIYSKVSGFVIYGKNGSEAQTYANNNGFTFRTVASVYTEPTVGRIKISDINIGGYRQPVAGEKPCKASDLICEWHYLYSYYVESCVWFKMEDGEGVKIPNTNSYVFEEGEEYYAKITVKAGGHGYFERTGDGGLDQFDSVLLDGSADYVDNYNSRVLWENELHILTEPYVANAPVIIRDVAVEGPLTFTTGDAPVNIRDFSVPENASYSISSVRWRDGETNNEIDAPEILESGKKYKLDIYLKSYYGYKFERTGYYGLSQFNSVTLNDSTEQLDPNNSGVFWGDTLGLRTKALTVTDPCGTTGDCTWSFNPITGLMTIDGNGEMADYTRTTAPWEEYKSKIKKVVFGNGVTKIGKYAFFECENLAELEIGGSVETIDQYAFSQCFALENVVIPNNIKYIESQAFFAAGIKSLTIGGSVKRIGASAFYMCENLKSVMVPASVTVIGNYALGFYRDDDNNTSSVYPGFTIYGLSGTTAQAYANDNHITFIAVEGTTGDCGWQFDSATGTLTISGSGAMFNYANQADVPWAQYSNDIIAIVFSGNVTSVGDYCFYNMPNLTSVYIPQSVKRIGKNAFATSALMDIGLNGVETIENNAFYGCANLMSADLGDSVKYIDKNAFMNCTSLNMVTLGHSVQDIGESAFSGCTSLMSINIPASVTVIGKKAFENCSGLGEVQFAQEDGSLNLIDEYAFSGCINLNMLDFPDSLHYIMDRAFSDCECLSTVTMSKELYQLGNKAFYNTNFTEIHLYGSLTNIGYHALGYRLGDSEDVALDLNIYGVSGSAAEAYANTESRFIFYPSNYEGRTGDCYWYYDDMNYSLTITGSGATGSYSLPSLVPWYGLNISELKIGKNVTSIGKYALAGIMGALIPETVTSIGENAVGCDQYGAPVDGYLLYGYRGSAAEDYADSHENIRFIDLKPRENYMGSIGFGAAWTFSEYTGTLTVYATAATGEMYDYEVFENKPWTYLGDKVKKVVIEDHITKVGEFAFADMTGIREVELSADVAKIGDAAFYNTGLDNLTVPNPSCKLGYYCFGYQNFPNGGLFDKMESATLIGHKGSTAQTYANGESHIKFEFIEGDELDLGDVDGNGTINIDDATTIQYYLADLLEKPLAPMQLEAADVDGDGYITIKDATTIQKYLVNLIDGFYNS
ncbi:MAG: leucine-rich repeat protein [Ruminococcus sp.]|nr:leucine-rich repeat protein [Ruminococcus sp.]